MNSIALSDCTFLILSHIAILLTSIPYRKSLPKTIKYKELRSKYSPLYPFGMIPVCKDCMKVAIPIWNDRVSPVFDAAQWLQVMTFQRGQEIDRIRYELKDCDFLERVNRLQQWDVQILLCGAISRPLESAIQSKGIRVVSHICGNVDEIIEAFLTNQITHPRFLMPGCCRRGRYRYQSGKTGCERKGHRRESGY